MDALYWLLAILIFGFLIFIHEMGHYLTARAFGVTIREFSIGMGPKMVTYTSKKTNIKYSLGVFPFGGYVSMVGEDEESDDPNALSKKAAWKRAIIVSAGAVMNLLLGFVLSLAMVLGSSALGSTVVSDFRADKFYTDNNFTDKSSTVLQIGDEILKINGHRVHTADDLQYEIQHEGGAEIPVTVRRGGEVMTLSVRFPTITESGVVFGIPDFYVEPEAKNLGNVLKHSYYQARSTVKMVFDSFGDLLAGKYGFEAVSGPVGVADAISDAAANNIWQLIYLVTVITVNLGIVNLFPFPALDGGRLVFILIEMIFRRPVPQKYEGIVHLVGIILLMLLMVVVLFKDVFTLFS